MKHKIVPTQNSSRIAFLALATVVLFFVASCKKKSDESSTNTPPPKLNLSAEQLNYGISPTKNSQVTYQDDVLIVEHGEDAIRGVSSDGMSVSIDASLPAAQQMQPGKIVFITNRAVGRVLGTQPDGNNLKLTLGPVDITEVIKDADLKYDQPLDLSSMSAYTAPDFPGAEIDAEKITRNFASPEKSSNGDSYALSIISPSGDWAPVRGYRVAAYSPANFSEATTRDSLAWTPKDIAAVRRIAAHPAPIPAALPPAASGSPSNVTIGDFQIQPFCCGGIGIKIVHDKNGVKILAYAVLRLSAPKIHFNLKITGGKVQTAGVTLEGASGLTMDFEAGSAVGLDGNINKQITLPVDLSIPIVGIPVPMAVTLRQSFILKTAFSAKNSTIKATGDYAFTGSLFMGYDNGQWTVSAPTTFSVKTSMTNSISGASVGVNGLVLAYQGKVIVGIGAFGFATGPYLGYIASAGITRGSDLGIVMCRGASLDISMSVGIGYFIPQPVTDAINFFLRNLNMSQIKNSGGLEHRENLIHKEETVPPSCGK